MCCKKYFFLTFSLIPIVLINCEKSYEPLKVYSDQKVILIEDFQNFNLDSIHIDPFSIDDVRIDEVADFIIFEVSYGGGCKEHQFQLYSSHGVLKTNPPGCLVYLSHNGNKDYCEAMVKSTISFSLKPFQNANYDALIFHLHGYKGKKIGTIWYKI